MKVLVTGGAGYIGAHTVVSLAEKGYQPIIVDTLETAGGALLKGIEKILSHPITFYQIDCKDKPTLQSVFEKENHIEAVIHFAAYKSVNESVSDPLKYYENNLLSLINLLYCVEKYKVKHVVFSSSCMVYGDNPAAMPVQETTPFQKAAQPYGNTKQIGEEMIEDFILAHSLQNKNTNAALLRYFNPIGAHPTTLIGELNVGKPSNLVPFITQHAAGHIPEVVVFGNDYATPDGTCLRDYIHIMDLADAHVQALHYLQNEQKNTCEAFNIGLGIGYSVLDIIKKFEEVTGKKIHYRIGERRSGDIERVFAKVQKAHTVLQWQPQYSIEQALLHAWLWQKNAEKS